MIVITPCPHCAANSVDSAVVDGLCPVHGSVTVPELPNPRKKIAELHAAGYSNEKIGYLLAQHGLSEPISEATVRRWAMRDGDPRLSQWIALKALHASVYPSVKSDEACQAS